MDTNGDREVRRYLGVVTYDDIIRDVAEAFARQLREIMKGKHR